MSCNVTICSLANDVASILVIGLLDTVASLRVE